MEYKITNGIYQTARRYPISCFYIAFIWIICFTDVPQTPLNDITLMDKWAHVLMYAGTCTTIWYEYIQQHEKINKIRLMLFAWLAPIAMSGLIEILQDTCTNGRRSADWLDFIANTTGVTLGAVIGTLLVKYFARTKKDS